MIGQFVLVIFELRHEVVYSYHSVYTDGKAFYDPFVSNKPVPQKDYIQMLKESNKNGVEWRVYEEGAAAQGKTELKKGNF